MDIDTAKLIAATLENAIGSVWGLLEPLRQRCSPEEFDLLKREIARVVGGIDQNFYPLLLKDHPELNPLRKSGA